MTITLAQALSLAQAHLDLLALDPAASPLLGSDKLRYAVVRNLRHLKPLVRDAERERARVIIRLAPKTGHIEDGSPEAVEFDRMYALALNREVDVRLMEVPLVALSLLLPKEEVPGIVSA